MRRRARLFGATALLACAGFAVQAGAAQAEPLPFAFDHARINLGDQKGIPLIDPSIPDPPAGLEADHDPATNAFTVPAAGVQIPDKTLENFSTGPPFNLIVDALIQFDALGDMQGTYDEQTGEFATSDLDLTVLITVYLDGTTPEDALGICRVEPVPLLLETAGEIVDDDGDPPVPVTYAAGPFSVADALPEGAVVTTWATLPTSVGEGGSLPGTVCPAIDGLLGGPGGIWFSGVQGEFPDPPPPPPPPPGGGGPQPRAASLSVSVDPKTKKAKANKKARFTATVRNTGELAANGTEVCVEASKKVKGAGCESLGSLGGNGSGSGEFSLKSKKKGKHALTFTASATGVGEANDTAQLKVKKKKKK